MSVPDSGNVAALGYSHASGIPYVEGLLKKQVHGAYFYSARAETEGTGGTDETESDRHECKGETNHPCGRLHCPRNNKRYHYPFAAECRRKGNKMCISSPPVRFPCFFGIDTAQRRQLVAASHSEEEICKMIGADKLHYLSQKGLAESISRIRSQRYVFCLL